MQLLTSAPTHNLETLRAQVNYNLVKRQWVKKSIVKERFKGAQKIMAGHMQDSLCL